MEELDELLDEEEDELELEDELLVFEPDELDELEDELLELDELTPPDGVHAKMVPVESSPLP